jgi:transmembrane sensor
MDELIARAVKGRLSGAEAEKLASWRQASARNEAYYQDLCRLLEEAESALLDEQFPPAPPITKLLHGTNTSRRGAAAARSRRRWLLIASAASVAAALIIAVFLPRPAAPAFSLQAGEFVTSATESGTTVLSDGTVVRLAPGSRLRIHGNPGMREVSLEGKAYFAVAAMPMHPFRVRTNAGDVVVLGTRFEVSTAHRDLRIVVVQGRVAIESGGQPVEVSAGEMSLVADGMATTPVRIDDVHELLGWMRRYLVFQATPLRDVARELEREYGITVVVTDSLLAGETITGWYGDRSFEEVFTIVCGVLQASCSIEDGAATIRPQSVTDI